MTLLKPIKVGMCDPVEPVFASPLCGFSDRPKRELDRAMGCTLAYPQMVSAEGLRRGDKKSCSIIDIDEEERPVGIQLFGSEPDAFYDAARIAEDCGASTVDINMGCPARKVTGNKSGAALMLEPQRVARIVRAASRAIEIPLTVKMRAGWSLEKGDAMLISKICEEEGASWITIHPRSREQKFKGRADWSVIAGIKQAVSIPVIGNGDIFTGADAVRMIRETGCDGVMIGRGGFGNPWLFAAIRRALQKEQLEEEDAIDPRPAALKDRLELLWRHAQLMVQWRHPTHGIVEFRKHGINYFKGIRNARLLKQAIQKAESLESLRLGLNRSLDEMGTGLRIESDGAIY